MNLRLQHTKMATAFIIAARSFATSCKKYLDVQPVSSFSPGFVFDNVNNAKAALYGTYAALTGD